MQLVLDPEFTAEVPPSPSREAGRHLVLEPEYLAECHGDAGSQQQVVPYD
ncbi:MAG: hypothetical protein WD030_06935 [Pirellulales bacterium]